MINDILFFIAVLMYCMGEGVTEGFTWAGTEEIDRNRLVGPNDDGKRLDYHAWRAIETFGIFGMMIHFDSFMLAVGSLLVGYNFYHSALCHIDFGNWLYEKRKTHTYYIMGREITYPPRSLEMVLGFLGLAIVIATIYARHQTYGGPV